MLDLHFITEQLAVGAKFPMAAAAALASEHGFCAVVDVREECCDDPAVLERNGLALLHLPTQDMTGLSLEMLDQGVTWVRERLASGEKVFIHCEHGVGRSALLAVCVLVDQRVAPLDALRHAKTRRKVISFSEPQQRRFLEWCEHHRARTGARWTTPSQGDVQRIVWGPPPA